MLSYDEITKLYNLCLFEENALRRGLYKFYDNIATKGADIFDAQEKEENELPVNKKNRFFRKLDDDKYRTILASKRFPEEYKCLPQIIIPSEKEYNSYSIDQKQNLEKLLYKRIAISQIRRANLANRFKYQEEDAFSQKDHFISDFLIYACKYNQMEIPENQIYFGFTEDDKNAVLDVCLPEYTRASVHFGTKYNFYKILKNVNDSLENDEFSKPFGEYKKNDKIMISNDVFENYPFSLERYTINTGIVNRDSGIPPNDNIFMQEDFKSMCYNENGTLNLEGLKDFVYTVCTEDYTSREIFDIAEKSGAGKKILIALDDLIRDREKQIINAKKENRTLEEHYIFSMDKSNLNTRITDMVENPEKEEMLRTFLIRLGEDPKGLKIDNIIELLKTVNNIDTRKKLFEIMIDEYSFGLKIDNQNENKSSTRELLIDYLISERKKNNDIRKQLYENALKLPPDEIKRIEDEENAFLEWLDQSR